MVSITQQTISDEIRRQQALSRSISADQAALSSGKKLLVPSQDPQAWVKVSELAQAQAQQASWTANVAYGKTRAAKAESNLEELNNLYTRARELFITASTATLDDTGKAAVVTELQGVRASISDLVNEKDYQGLPVFDDGAVISMPVARGINIDAVGTRQSITDGIDVEGTTMTLDSILGAAITSIQSGTAATNATALNGLTNGLDHLIGVQSQQGVRSNRLDSAGERLVNVDLNLSERKGALEDTDPTETLVRMQSKLTSLEAAQAAFARINRQSLFDLIS